MFEILLIYYIYFNVFILIGGCIMKVIDVIEYRKYREEIRKEEEKVRRKNQKLRKMVIALNEPIEAEEVKDLSRQTVIVKGVFANEA